MSQLYLRNSHLQTTSADHLALVTFDYGVFFRNIRVGLWIAGRLLAEPSLASLVGSDGSEKVDFAEFGPVDI